MKRINSLLEKYHNTPPCISVVGDAFYTEDALLGKICS